MEHNFLSSRERRLPDISTTKSENLVLDEKIFLAPCACGRKGRFGCGKSYACPRTTWKKENKPSSLQSRSPKRNLSPKEARRQKTERELGLAKNKKLPGTEPVNLPLDDDRVSSAIRKAYRVRCLSLKRHLDQQEFDRLCVAVRKQCKLHHKSHYESILGEHDRRLRMLEKAQPLDISSLQDAIENTYSQLEVLRNQLLVAIQEQEDSSLPSCTHLKYQTKAQLFEGFQVYHDIPSFGFIYHTFGPTTLRLACPKCIQNREDVVFSWTGHSCPTLSEIVSEGYLPPALKKLSPLAVPQLWNQVLDLKYNRSA
jgi:hypothetical protein